MVLGNALRTSSAMRRRSSAGKQKTSRTQSLETNRPSRLRSFVRWFSRKRIARSSKIRWSISRSKMNRRELKDARRSALASDLRRMSYSIKFLRKGRRSLKRSLDKILRS